jgi:peptidoglycan hydrolase-like protein with peptidoglycan-binding domain/cell wall-associated NlpC family hydrolase
MDYTAFLQKEGNYNMADIIKDTIIEGNPGYLVFFDNVRVDKFVRDFSVNLSVDGSIGTATINMLYVPDLDKIIHKVNQSLIQTTTEKSSVTTTSTTQSDDYGINSWPNILKKGSTGNAVKQLQQWLLDLGYSEVKWADGIFGSMTTSGVMKFQRDNGCSADGIVGPQTKGALKTKIKSSTSTSSTTNNQGITLVVDDGVENMTNVRIFIRNIFSRQYVQVFEGNIRAKSTSFSGGEFYLSFQAYDYMNWLNRTICPIAVPLDNTLTPGDRLRWKAQGIDINKVKTVPLVKDISFKGKNISQMWQQISDQTLSANSLYNTKDSVASWDNVLNRIAVMGDIDENLRNAQVMDFMVSNAVTSVNTIYVLMNDILKTLLFEFYQDRDGVIRIKPPFWNENVLTNHVIDGSLIINFSESVNWNNYYTRIIATGGLDEWEQTDTSSNTLEQSLLTPVVAYASNGITANSGPVVGAYQAGVGAGGDSDLGNAICNYARSFIGVPYIWGGASPNGFDCSGLVQYVFQHYGYPLPRTTYEQINIGTQINSSDLAPGDLMFFGVPSAPSHVAIYSGGGKMIEAPQSGMTVRETTLRTPSACRRVIGSGYQEGSNYLSHTGGTSGTKPTSVGPDELLKLTIMEQKYGPLIYDITQPLIKFSTSGSVDNSGSAYEALQKYAKFMLNFLNSAVSMASINTIAMPWIRPGFNVWIDPIRVDKIFYVNSVVHQGSPAGCYSTFNLTMGRDRNTFLNNPSVLGSLKPGQSDDVFINTLKVKPENFGQLCDYNAIITASKEFHASTNAKDISITKADTSQYFKKLYIDSIAKQSQFAPQSAISGSATALTSSASTRRSVDFDGWPSLLKNGSSGNAVKELQGVLMDLGYTEVTWTDGIFGPKTKSGVVRFQREHGLSVDGIVGPQTRAALKNAYGGNTNTSTTSTSSTSGWRLIMQIGSSGDDVKQLQQILKNIGYSEVTWVDGIFGPKTAGAVKRFQREHSLSVDGIVGPQTRAVIDKTIGSTSSSSNTGVDYTAYGKMFVFDQEYTEDTIETKLNSLYELAPDVVKNRSTRLNKLISNVSDLMNQIYIGYK